MTSASHSGQQGLKIPQNSNRKKKNKLKTSVLYEIPRLSLTLFLRSHGLLQPLLYLHSSWPASLPLPLFFVFCDSSSSSTPPVWLSLKAAVCWNYHTHVHLNCSVINSVCAIESVSFPRHWFDSLRVNQVSKTNKTYLVLNSCLD